MIDTKTRIARDLHRQFSEWGFATQGVEALREGAEVSLRTLYKHFPSREAMIVGALEHRDRIYFEWIQGGPDQGAEHVLHPIERLGDWLYQIANTGCLFMNALSAYPDSPAIYALVERHKTRLSNEFQKRLARVAPNSDTKQLADALFLLHEGLTQAARLQGPEKARANALRAASAALRAEGIL